MSPGSDLPQVCGCDVPRGTVSVDYTGYQRLVAERDRYKEALERIASGYTRTEIMARGMSALAREALDG